jgi:hypothetical protein
MSEYRFFLLHKLLVTGVNLLILGALFMAMYRASLYPDDFTPVFFETIFTLLIPSLLLGYVGKRMLNKHRSSLA